MGQVWAVLMSSGSLGNIFLLGGAFFDTQFPAIPVERASCAVFSLFSSFFFFGGGQHAVIVKDGCLLILCLVGTELGLEGFFLGVF